MTTALKAAGAGRLILAVADRHQPSFAAAFRQSMQRTSSRITVDMVASAIDHPSGLSALLALVDEAPVIKAADPASLAVRAYADVLHQAAKVTLSSWAAANAIAPPASLVASLAVKSPFMQRAAKEMTAKLVRVRGETKVAIRELIHDAVLNGVGPYETALEIREIVGLTRGQAKAVRNYRTGLREVGEKVRSHASLRSQWTLSPKVGRSRMTEAQVERFTGAYADRLLDYRSYNIARTETLRASNMGQQMTWEAMADGGFIDRDTFVRVWSVIDDDRLCEECAPMDGQSVGLDEDFASTEVGVLPSERRSREEAVTTETPPLHPSCRCVLMAG